MNYKSYMTIAFCASVLSIGACVVPERALDEGEVFLCKTSDDCMNKSECVKKVGEEVGRCVLSTKVRHCVDADGDGFEAPTAPEYESECGFTNIRPKDCNDTDKKINPNAEERCDGVDNNCDGVIDGHMEKGVEQKLTLPCEGYKSVGVCARLGQAVCKDAKWDRSSCLSEVDEQGFYNVGGEKIYFTNENEAIKIGELISILNDPREEDENEAAKAELSKLCDGKDNDCDGVNDKPFRFRRNSSLTDVFSTMCCPDEEILKDVVCYYAKYTSEGSVDLVYKPEWERTNDPNASEAFKEFQKKNTMTLNAGEQSGRGKLCLYKNDEGNEASYAPCACRGVVKCEGGTISCVSPFLSGDAAVMNQKNGADLHAFKVGQGNAFMGIKPGCFDGKPIDLDCDGKITGVEQVNCGGGPVTCDTKAEPETVCYQKGNEVQDTSFCGTLEDSKCACAGVKYTCTDATEVCKNKDGLLLSEYDAINKMDKADWDANCDGKIEYLSDETCHYNKDTKVVVDGEGTPCTKDGVTLPAEQCACAGHYFINANNSKTCMHAKGAETKIGTDEEDWDGDCDGDIKVATP